MELACHDLIGEGREKTCLFGSEKEDLDAYF